MTRWYSFARIMVAACLAAAAGCTPMRWEHPQLGIASLDDDTQECDSLAWREASRYAYSFGPRYYPYPNYLHRRDGTIIYSRPYPRYRNDAFFEEMRLRDYCMRAKGYRPMPVPGPVPG